MDRYDSMLELEPELDGMNLRIGIVMSRCNRLAGEDLLGACTTTLAKHGVDSGKLTLATVPGVLEIPLMLKELAETGNYDALIALGTVVRGDMSYRFEVVCNECAAGITRVQLDSGVPIANGVLVSDSNPVEFTSLYGARAAATAVEMANLVRPFRVFRSGVPRDHMAAPPSHLE
jgi:6,7-dimethyl-8-ribityllumazine synthase